MTDFEYFVLGLGPLETNCIVMVSAGQCVVVDPAWPEGLVDVLQQRGLCVDQVWLTHGHGDHIGGVSAVCAAWPQARLIAPQGDLEMLDSPRLNLSAMFGLEIRAPQPAATVTGGDELELGQLRWRVLDTSGHTPGGVSYYCEQASLVLAGDALFAGSVGRTDIPGGDHARLIANIHRNLLSLPGQTVVVSGHGPATTIGREKACNPYL